MIRALFAASAILLVAACSENAAMQPLAEARQIHVTGEGVVSAAPDIAMLTFSVRSQAPGASEAFAQTTRLAGAVLAEVEAQGVEARDRQTVQINLNPIYARENGRGYDRNRVAAYEAVMTLNVRLRDIDKAGEVIDAAVEAGANGLDRFHLTFDDPSALQDQARIAAVEDAMAKAEAMAEAAGARLGEVVTISTQGSGGARPAVLTRSSMAAEAAPVIAAGEQDLRVTVSATFTLK